MSDITANVVVSMPSQLFTLARSFKAASNGKIYIGLIDTDPTIPSNRVQVYVENEDNTLIPVAQPIVINDGGFPVFGGQIAKFVTAEGHSMAVYDSYGAQQFYFPNVLKYNPDQLRTELNTEGTPTIVDDSRIRIVQPLTGSVLRTQHAKNSDIIGGGDFGMVGDGFTDNTAAVNAAISAVSSQGEILLPSNGSTEAKQYRINGITNSLGIRFKGRGALVLPDPNGGIRQINFHQDDYYQALGFEYLYPVYQKLTVGQGDANGQLKVFLYGDSTVAGGNGESAPFRLETYLSNQLAVLGIPNATITNRGVGGTSILDMNATPDVTAGADLFIIKYGINDGGNGRPDRLQYFATNLRSKLAGIRAINDGKMQNLSIILVGPNSTNDSPNNRNAYWYEQLRNIYLQAARDYQCGYFDTYSMMPDSYGLAGFSLDAPSTLAPGVGIHPMDSMQTWIWGKFLDTYFNRSSVAPYVSNAFVNVGAISGAPTAATLPNNYRVGINIYRAKVSDGFPIDGVAVTIRHVDQPTLMFVYGFSAGFSKCITRTANISNNTWNQFTGTLAGLTLSGGWSAAITPGYRVSSDGLVTISATLTGGTTTSGTTILTGIPAALRPTDNKILTCANGDGSHLAVTVKTDGTIALATGSTASIQVNVSYYI